MPGTTIDPDMRGGTSTVLDAQFQIRKSRGLHSAASKLIKGDPALVARVEDFLAKLIDQLNHGT
jgi:hypothetical protein